MKWNKPFKIGKSQINELNRFWNLNITSWVELSLGKCQRTERDKFTRSWNMLDGSRMSAVVIWEKILRQAVTRITRKIGDMLTKLQFASMRLTAAILNFHGLSFGLPYPVYCRYFMSLTINIMILRSDFVQ